jgi:uncharacterized coiled-coil protein SlyX
VEQQTQDLEFYQSCLTLVSDGLDSIAKADNNLMTVATNKEKTITRESIKQDLDAYASLLTRQRERINQLESQMGEGGKDRERMQALIDHLNQQIAEKDATIQKLQEKLETQEFNVALLQDEINYLYSQNARLKDDIREKDERINVAHDLLNEAYYIIGTSSELKKAGVLSSRFLGKSKVDVDNIDARHFTKIDIRKFGKLTINSKSITLKSQHPKDSYKTTTDKKAGTTTLEILDKNDFWGLTHFLIIQE